MSLTLDREKILSRVLRVVVCMEGVELWSSRHVATFAARDGTDPEACCFKNKKEKVSAKSKITILINPPPPTMSVWGLCSFRLISRYNNFLCASAVFRSNQQTASLTSFLSAEVIKRTAVHRLTVPAAQKPQLP